MGVIEAFLALIGLVAVVVAVARRQLRREPAEPVVEADRAAPYRAGLHAAVRMQGAAHDLEQQIHAEAVRHAENPTDGQVAPRS